MQTYQDLNLSDITPCSFNPRKHFDGPKYEELVTSVREKGVIEPIIVRPRPGAKAPYELVAGERRFRAARDCQLQTIPAIIRELTDDEAYDFMLIENLHREDLTELEEAESFKAYVERHGEDGIPTFASKTGISPRYIRARIHVLQLPKEVLARWKAGQLKYGHLEQLLRVNDDDERGELVECLKGKAYPHLKTVGDLREAIDRLQINLGAARFKVKDECAGCRNNSAVQQDLFGIGPEKASCTKTDCFREKQRAWLTANWEKTTFRKEYKTNGFRFDGEVNYNHRKEFFDWNGAVEPVEKCYACEKFVTFLHVNGKVEDKRVCLDPGCYKRLETGKKTGKKAAEMPRAARHGEYFRDRFYRPLIEAKVTEINPLSPNGLAVLVAAAAVEVSKYRGVAGLAKILKTKETRGFRYQEAVEKILAAPPETLAQAARAVILDIVMDGQSCDKGCNSDGFTTINRAAVARFLGIDLAREYHVNEEYLQKKTTAELEVFIRKHDLAKYPAFRKSLPENMDKKAKKSEIVKAVLAIGEKDLLGKVPDEILNVGKEKRESRSPEGRQH